MRWFFVSCWLATSLAWAGPGQELWDASDEAGKVEIFKAYREWYRVVAEVDDLPNEEWEDQRTTFWSLIMQKAWAGVDLNEMNCTYAGWPSVRTERGCRTPWNSNDNYPDGSCPVGEVLCNPLLYGKGESMCAVMSSPTESCETKATKTPEQIVAEITTDEKLPQLKELLNWADKLCSEGASDDDGESDERLPATDARVGVRNERPCAALRERIDKLRLLTIDRTLALVADGIEPTLCSDGTGGNLNLAVTSTSVGLTPEQMIAAANAADLRFMGRSKFAGSISHDSCAFENAQVVVVYEYCNKNGSPAPALGIKIFARTGGVVSFYVENSEAAGVDFTDRSKYDRAWRTAFQPTAALPDRPSVDNIRAIDASLKSYPHGFCRAGGISGEGLSVTAPSCSSRGNGQLEAFAQTWANSSNAFLENPGDAWVTLQNSLKSKASSAR